MKLINSIQTNHPNYSFSFYGAERLILHDRYGTVYIRSAKQNNKEIISFFDDEKLETNAANILAVSPDLQFFASSNDDGIIRVWNIKEKTKVSRFKIADTFIWSLKFSPANKSIIAGGGNGSVYICRLEGGVKKELSGSPIYPIYSLDINPVNPEIIACGTGIGGIVLWDIDREEARLIQYESGGNRAIYLNHKPKAILGFVHTVKFLDDGTKIVSGDSDGLLRIWNTELVQQETFDLCDSNSKINNINAIACRGDDMFVARYRHIFRGSIFQPTSLPILVAGMDEDILDIAISPDGKLIAFGGYEPKIDVYSLDE